MDYFSALPDEMIVQVLKWLPIQSLGRIVQTSSKFLRLATDESLWKRLNLVERTIFKHNAGVIMSRKPVYLRLARAMILEPSGIGFGIGLEAPRLVYLDLSSAFIGAETLENLLGMCRNLKKLSLEQLRIPPSTLAKMEVFTRTLDTLNLTMCSGLQTGALSQYLSKCSRLHSLNLGWIESWTSEDLTMIVNSLVKNIESLNLAGFRNSMLDAHVEVVTRRCPDLIDLDLSDCQILTGDTLFMLTALKELQHLALSRCHGIEETALLCLADMTSLKSFEMFHMTDLYEEIDIIKPNLLVNMYLYSSVGRPVFGNDGVVYF